MLVASNSEKLIQPRIVLHNFVFVLLNFYKHCMRIHFVQGVPIINYPKLMAVELKWCIFDYMLVKPKCN